MSMLAEAQRLYEMGYDLHWIVPAEKGNRKSGKRPVGNWRRTERKSWEDLEESYREGYNLGFQPGKSSIVRGKQVIVVEYDPDEEETGREVLEGLVGARKPTVRSGGGGEHYHVLVDAELDVPTGAVLWAGSSKHNEIRVIAATGNCVLPPSKHWTGGSYTWESGKPSKANPTLLARLGEVVRVKATAGELEVGQSLTLRDMGGRLARVVRSGGGAPGGRSEQLYWAIAEMYRKGFSAENIVATILNEDYEISSKPIEQGAKWAKREVARVIAKVEAEAEKKESDDESAIAEIGEKYFIISNGGSVRIGCIGDDGTPSFYTRRDFELLMANRRTMKGEPLGEMWLQSPGRRELKAIVFDPTVIDDADSDRLNLWRGFAIAGEKGGSCDLFKKHLLDNVASGDNDRYEWIWNWMAHMIQYPGEKPGTIPVMRGATGVGKSFVANVIRRIVGDRHSLSVSKRELLTGRFNSHLANKLFIVGEEITWGGSIDVNAVLRDFSTNAKIIIEPKGMTPYELDSFHRLMLISNEDWIVHAMANERRYMVFDVGHSKQKDTRYFGAIARQLDSGGYERLMYELSETRVNRTYIGRVIESEALAEQQQRSLAPVDRWWHDCLVRGEIVPRSKEWPDRIERYRLLNSFKASDHRHSDYETVGTLVRAIGRRVFPGRKWSSLSAIRRSGIVNYRLPELETCRTAFAESMGWDQFR